MRERRECLFPLIKPPLTNAEIPRESGYELTETGDGRNLLCKRTQSNGYTSNHYDLLTI